MRERLEAGNDVHGLVIRALEQTGARGTRRRDWSAGLGGSYQTLAVKDETGRLRQPHVAIAIAIGLAQTLPEYGIQVGIKWPNDLHYCGRKVAGILCEYTRGHLLAAVGMNVNNDVPAGAAALRGLDTEGVSNFVLAGLQNGLELLANSSSLPDLFAPFDVLKDKALKVMLTDRLERGVARGIDPQGCLQLETHSGTVSLCHGVVRGKLELL